MGDPHDDSPLVTKVYFPPEIHSTWVNDYFRHAKHIVQLITSLGIFFTPDFFDLDAFGRAGARTFSPNPLTPILEGTRGAAPEIPKHVSRYRP